MNTIAAYLTDDHHHCDELFAEAEDAAASRDWPACRKSFTEFQHSMAHHFAMEEKELFPAVEQHSGSTMDPTQVMREEHSMIRDLLQQMASAQQEENQDRYLSLSETLLIMMQQHNLKEEQMLYPMADHLFVGERDTVLSRMAAVEE